MFMDASKAPLVSFKIEVITRMYALRTPQQLLIEEFMKKSIPQFNLNELIKFWLDEPTLYARITGMQYLLM